MLLRACIALATVVVVVGPVSPVQGQACGYEIETVVYGPGCGILGPATMHPQHLRDGIAVGWYATCGFGAEVAWQWGLPLGLQTLAVPAGADGTQAAAREGDVVVGSYLTGNEPQALMWDGGSSVELGTGPGGNWSQAEAISNGVIVGTWGNSVIGPTRAFRWHDGVFEDLSALLGGSTTRGRDVNAAGNIVGLRRETPGDDPIAFRLEGDELTLLGPLPGGFESQAFAINDSREVVGTGKRFDDVIGDDVVRAFVWREGGMTDLGTLPGYELSGAGDISNSGLIVGQVWSPGSAAVIWINDEIFALQDLVADTKELYFGSAVSIDEDGRILVSANVSSPIGDRVAVILAPVETLPGDLNCDGQVGLDDFWALLDAWGPCPDAGPCPGDLNGNGNVGIIDFLRLLANWT